MKTRSRLFNLPLPVFLGVAVVASASVVCAEGANVLDPALMQRHCDSFAATDEELYVNAVDNAHAYEFLKRAVALLS